MGHGQLNKWSDIGSGGRSYVVGDTVVNTRQLTAFGHHGGGSPRCADRHPFGVSVAEPHQAPVTTADGAMIESCGQTDRFRVLSSATSTRQSIDQASLIITAVARTAIIAANI
jgi:hypothetical protein